MCTEQVVQRKLPWADSCEYHRCSVCGAPQPTERLLDIHLSEIHDSFFAAQAARKLKARDQPVEHCTTACAASSRALRIWLQKTYAH